MLYIGLRNTVFSVCSAWKLSPL